MKNTVVLDEAMLKDGAVLLTTDYVGRLFAGGCDKLNVANPQEFFLKSEVSLFLTMRMWEN